jgi:hypothetical protein
MVSAFLIQDAHRENVDLPSANINKNFLYTFEYWDGSALASLHEQFALFGQLGTFVSVVGSPEFKVPSQREPTPTYSKLVNAISEI